MSERTYLIVKAQARLKDKSKQSGANGAIVGAGATTAGVGAIAGGIPGVKAKHTVWANTKEKQAERSKLSRPRRAVAGAKDSTAHLGGIFGTRMAVHRGVLQNFKADVADDKRGPARTASHAYAQGRRAGQVEPEVRVLRHMRGAKMASGAAVFGGLGTAAYGVHRGKKTKVRKDQRSAGTLAGAGGAATALTYGGTAALRDQSRRWEKKAAKGRAEAGRLVPKTVGHSGDYIQDHPSVFHGTGPAVARRAGALRGAATQHQHFAEVYHDAGKVVGHLRVPSAVAAGVGIGGLAAMKTKKKKPVKKGLKPHHIKILERERAVSSGVLRMNAALGEKTNPALKRRLDYTGERLARREVPNMLAGKDGASHKPGKEWGSFNARSAKQKSKAARIVRVPRSQRGQLP